MSELVFYKVLPFLIDVFTFVMSCIAGVLVYNGLTSKMEREQNRIRMRNSIGKSKQILTERTMKSKADALLRRAGNPLGLNGARYYFGLAIFSLFLLIYYAVIPVLLNGRISMDEILSVMAIFLLVVLLMPSFQYSIANYFLQRLEIYQIAKKHAEVFMLYDLLINEIEMMTSSRINTYSVLRNIKAYFVVLEAPFTKLLSSWSSNEGPKVALDNFNKDLHSKEAEALIGVIKNLDDIDRDTALEHLRGMHSMFVKTQIENYRRKRKITTDLLGLPIKTTHFIIILNFLVLVVTMVNVIMSGNKL